MSENNRVVFVVVVDPNPDDYVSFSPLVETRWLDLRLITTGRAALRFASEMQADLYVINTRLPDMSGFDLVQMLQSLQPKIPIYVVGNYYRKADEFQSLSLGASRYLCKPLETTCLGDVTILQTQRN